jgi:hypothetical protein
MSEEYHDSEDQEYFLDPEELRQFHREAARAQFIEWCNEGYSMLTKNMELTDVAEKEEANLAMRRMLGYFIDEEEYEKCKIIKTSLDSNFPGNTEPLFDYREI